MARRDTGGGELTEQRLLLLALERPRKLALTGLEVGRRTYGHRAAFSDAPVTDRADVAMLRAKAVRRCHRPSGSASREGTTASLLRKASGSDHERPTGRGLIEEPLTQLDAPEPGDFVPTVAVHVAGPLVVGTAEHREAEMRRERARNETEKVCPRARRLVQKDLRGIRRTAGDEVDDATERSGAVESGGGTLDHLDLAKVEWWLLHEPEAGRVRAEKWQPVIQHQRVSTAQSLYADRGRAERGGGRLDSYAAHFPEEGAQIGGTHLALLRDVLPSEDLHAERLLLQTSLRTRAGHDDSGDDRCRRSQLEQQRGIGSDRERHRDAVREEPEAGHCDLCPSGRYADDRGTVGVGLRCRCPGPHQRSLDWAPRSTHLHVNGGC